LVTQKPYNPCCAVIQSSFSGKQYKGMGQVHIAMKLVPSKLSKELHVIQLLSTRDLLKEELFSIRDEAYSFFGNAIPRPFVAFCFGRYDVIVDLFGVSGDSLVQKSHDFELRINKILKERARRNSSVSSSLLFYRHILDKRGQCLAKVQSPVRAYCFLRYPAGHSEECQNRVDESYMLPKGSGLFWNPSLYSVLLIVGATSYQEAASKVFAFLGAFKGQLRRSSTLVTVNLDKQNPEKPIDENLRALTFVKMKRFEKISAKIEGAKSASFAPGEYVNTFGWYDQCRFQETRTLWELMSNILDMRKEYPSIDYTSTTILYYEGT
jgi:hypothetical protein